MRSKSKTILYSGFLSGTLDILAAILIYSVILHQTTAVKILQSIASGMFKKEAYTNGSQMALYGLLLHYFIAFLFAYIYFKIYPYLPFLRQNFLLSGIIYGIFVWIVMNLIVLPIVFPELPAKQFDFPLLLSILILIFCIGLPIAYVTKKFYTRH
ncbi:putative membrane protein YagU involved in acid resistance [Flavobacterium sp. HSC-32F16]|uniref:DUF1440 domain-containing protein n=1 Tax=Flavobacterium sp. HSC-32F16 TaxID=2910964 RepID=UPI0020A520B3|nr:DUF1440 domain-containing protein [Flavobacterium sp. HSC-32F16]MCP2028603.1 putative membrane protein YagU involved in acid resistance [Flavobacterium sp. HSC-32F16]